MCDFNFTRNGLTLKFNRTEEGCIRLDLNSLFYTDKFIEPDIRLFILTQYALSCLQEEYVKYGLDAALALPDKESLDDGVFNYANFCVSIGFPDLQDSGIFGQAVQKAWEMFEIQIK